VSLLIALRAFRVVINVDMVAQNTLRANISETGLVLLINEQ